MRSMYELNHQSNRFCYLPSIRSPCWKRYEIGPWFIRLGFFRFPLGCCAWTLEPSPIQTETQAISSFQHIHRWFLAEMAKWPTLSCSRTTTTNMITTTNMYLHDMMGEEVWPDMVVNSYHEFTTVQENIGKIRLLRSQPNARSRSGNMLNLATNGGMHGKCEMTMKDETIRWTLRSAKMMGWSVLHHFMVKPCIRCHRDLLIEHWSDWKRADKWHGCFLYRTS